MVPTPSDGRFELAIPLGIATWRLVLDDIGVKGVSGGSVDAETLRPADEDEGEDGNGAGADAGDVAIDCCQSEKVLSNSDSDVTDLNNCAAAAVAAGVGSCHCWAWESIYTDPGTRNRGQPGRDALRFSIQVDCAGGDVGETGSDLSSSPAAGGLAGSSAQSGMSTRDVTVDVTSESSSTALGLALLDEGEISTFFGAVGGAGFFFRSVSLCFGSGSRTRRRLSACATTASSARPSGCRLHGAPHRSHMPPYTNE